MAEFDENSQPKKINIVDAILDLKSRDPFKPFRITMSSGDKFVIEVGGNLVELKSEFFYARPGGESFTFLRKNQIVTVELIEHRRSSRRKAS